MKYFELLNVHGEIQQEDLDEAALEEATVKYGNNLQIAETRERQLKKKIGELLF